MKYGKTYIVEERRNPSTDLYINSFFAGQNKEFIYLNFDTDISQIDFETSTFVFVRYVPIFWKKIIKKNVKSIKSIYYFIDDDLLDKKAYMGLPKSYRTKISKLCHSIVPWLRDNDVQLLVSNSFLKKKYSFLNPELVHPKPLPFTEKCNRFFYHGSTSHMLEIEWLVDVVDQVLKQNPLAIFEIIGDSKVAKLFTAFERVIVCRPMSWETYRFFIQQPGRQVGLAPLMENPFNNARTHTKFFDITQAGSVGIYSNHPVYDNFVKDGGDGILLRMDKHLWTEKILYLLNDCEYRERLYQGALSRVQSMLL